MTRIKICGIKQKEHALAAVKAGTDLIGLVFAPSKRQITSDQAKEISAIVKKTSNSVKIVGVFVNTPSSEINRIADYSGLDIIQLSGYESFSYCSEINRPIFKSILIGAESSNQIYATMDTYSMVRQDIVFLLDTYSERSHGGTGTSFNWELAIPLVDRFKIIVAGGLTPHNVTKTIKICKPWGVDVSSGVETNGIKDVTKIKDFIDSVKKVDKDGQV